MKRKTIRNHKDFFTSPDDPVYVNRVFIAKSKPAVKKDARYGIIAAKRTFKLAVQRNRAKRLLRDWIRFNEKYLRPDMDYVFIARRDILDATRDDGRAAMARALTYLNKNPKTQPKNAE